MATTKTSTQKARTPAPPAAAEATTEPKPGVLLRGYRLSLRSIEGVGVTIGSNALAGPRLAGMPKTWTKKMQNGQSKALKGVTGWSDDVGTKVAHGIGTGKTLAAEGAKQGAKTWARGMKFFITLK
jgi:hypothetical protein